MDFIDINKENEKIILLIHPMSFTAEGVEKIITKYMSGDFRYIIPELANHGKSNEIFKSSQIEAEKIQKYLLDNQIEEIDLGFGASLGAIVLLNILNNKKINFKKSIFEGCSLYENSRFTEILFRKVFLGEHKKSIKSREFAIKKMSEEYGDDLSELLADCFIKMDEKSIKNIVHDFTFVNLPKLTKEEQERCIFCYGSKDILFKEAKKSIIKKLPYVDLKIWDGFSHCNKITKDSVQYCEFLESQI